MPAFTIPPAKPRVYPVQPPKLIDKKAHDRALREVNRLAQEYGLPTLDRLPGVDGFRLEKQRTPDKTGVTARGSTKEEHILMSSDRHIATVRREVKTYDGRRPEHVKAPVPALQPKEAFVVVIVPGKHPDDVERLPMQARKSNKPSKRTRKDLFRQMGL